jgi:tRNA-2-methylthio-N6-dimethylallyladenosine synthase
VGFPGETDADYKLTREVAEEVQFDNAFIFRYSRRSETPAAEMPDQVDESVKEQRNQDLLELINASTRRANEKLVGTKAEILCEGPSKTNTARLMGRTRTNKVVVFEADEDRIGQIFDVAIERANGFSLYGRQAK